MKLLGRDVSRVALAAGRRDHYRALHNTFKVYDRPITAIGRYLFGVGDYPWLPTLSTPVGPIRPKLFTEHDVLTVNEIFCRHDYGRGNGRVFVDIGANIGIASLFFLTRNRDNRVYAAEPAPGNLPKLLANLEAYEDRWFLDRRAVSTSEGPVRFLVEPTGRYGGISSYSNREGSEIEVESISISAYLTEVVSREGWIDLVKIDTEGNERDLVESIPGSLLSEIGEVVWENNDGTTRRRKGLEILKSRGA